MSAADAEAMMKAARLMSDAADRMQRVVSNLDGALYAHGQQWDARIARLEALAKPHNAGNSGTGG